MRASDLDQPIAKVTRNLNRQNVNLATTPFHNSKRYDTMFVLKEEHTIIGDYEVLCDGPSQEPPRWVTEQVQNIIDFLTKAEGFLVEASGSAPAPEIPYKHRVTGKLTILEGMVRSSVDIVVVAEFRIPRGALDQVAVLVTRGALAAATGPTFEQFILDLMRRAAV